MKPTLFRPAISLVTFVVFFSISNLIFAFSDVSTSHQNYDAIMYLYDRGDVQGYDDDTFRPENNITRAEFLKILVEGADVSPDSTVHNNCFPDTTVEWYASYVCFAQAREWVEGYPDNTFKPGENVNNVEALKMLLETQNIKIDNSVEGEWYAPYVAKAHEMQLLDGSAESFIAGEAVTRGEVVEQMYRTHLWLEGKEHSKTYTHELVSFLYPSEYTISHYPENNLILVENEFASLSLVRGSMPVYIDIIGSDADEIIFTEIEAIRGPVVQFDDKNEYRTDGAGVIFFFLQSATKKVDGYTVLMKYDNFATRSEFLDMLKTMAAE